MTTRIYAIGDIHGRLDLLDQLYLKIIAHAAADKAERRVLLHLGDYIDRGPDPKGVIERIMAGLTAFESVALMGNHEQAMLDYIGTGSSQAAGLWLDLGGAETLESFGIDPSRRLNRREIVHAIGSDKLLWLCDLPTSHREGGLFFAHAGIKPGVPFETQAQEDLLWIREPFTTYRHDFGLRVVHGHSPSIEPTVRPNRIGLDTGAVWTGRLTAAVLDPEQPHADPLLLSTAGADFKEVTHRAPIKARMMPPLGPAVTHAFSALGLMRK